MHRSTSRVARRLVAAAGGLALAGLALLPTAASADPHPAPVAGPVVAGSGYLALGDSVSFGYREPTTLPRPDYTRAASFVGYPEEVAAALGLHLTNLACPGETSGSFINAAAQSNGCENSLSAKGMKVPVGYRTAYPLHAGYEGSQLAAAVEYLRHHPDTRLVSLMIGANDGFLCQKETSDGCTSAAETTALAKEIATNVATILGAIRRVYHGQIAVVGYYSLDYANKAASQSSQLLDAAQAAGARPFHVEMVNGYGSFRAAAKYSGGNSCTAGLLTQLSTGGCGVHPSPGGQAVLAQAVEATVVK